MESYENIAKREKNYWGQKAVKGHSLEGKAWVKTQQTQFSESLVLSALCRKRVGQNPDTEGQKLSGLEFNLKATGIP